MPAQDFIPSMPAPPQLGKLGRVLRAQEWWEYKITRHVGVAFAFAYHEHLPVWSVLGQTIVLLLASVCCAGFVSVINDITDREADALAGKPNALIGMSLAFQAAAVLACVVPGAFVGWLMRDCPVALVAYALIWLVFILYSFPPIRLKSRGVAGAIADGVGEQVLPAWMAASLMTEANHHEVSGFFLVPLLVWSFAFGFRGILDHQMSDRDNDRAAGLTTVATSCSVPFLSRVVNWAIYPVEIVAMLVFLAMFHLVWVWPILALCLLIETRHGHLGQFVKSWRDPAPENWLPLVEYYKVYFPLTFLLPMVWSQPAMLWVLLLQLVLFSGCNRQAAYAVAGLLLAPLRGGYAAWYAGSSRGNFAPESEIATRSP